MIKINRFPSVVEGNNTSSGYIRDVKEVTYQSLNNYAGWDRYPGVTAIRDATAETRFIPKKLDPPPKVKRKKAKSYCKSRARFIYQLYVKNEFIGDFTANELIEEGFFNSIKTISSVYKSKRTTKSGCSLNRESRHES